jgi:quercetin dioxygenase-like cupin family protein
MMEILASTRSWTGIPAGNRSTITVRQADKKQGYKIMQYFKAGSRPTKQAPASYFTGTVWQDPINEPPEPARARSAWVTFEPGARTAWHTHPLGQTLVVTSGVGRFQTKGQPVVTLKPGDVVWIPPGEKHWHGAAPDTGMVHLAIHEALDGSHINWMEHVTDEEYLVAPGV